MKTDITDSKYIDSKFSINIKKYEAMGVIMTYNLRGIFFHTREIDCPHVICTKMKNLFNKINEIKLM